MTIDIIRQTFKLAKAARETHEDEISEAYKFTRPNRDIWRNRESHTDRTKISDSTAPDSVQNLVSTILNLLIPQNQQWATLSVREDERINEIDDRNGGLTIFTSTDQTGNFRIGDGVIINQQTGTISGEFYSKSLFSQMTPFILALGGD